MHDMKHLDKLGTLNAAAKEGMDTFWAFDKAAFAEGAIDGKTQGYSSHF